MDHTVRRTLTYAGALFCAVLLTSTSATAQQRMAANSQRPSIISLEPAPIPVGASLARRAGDATFAKLPPNYHVFTAATVGEQTPFETLTLKFAGETTLVGLKMTNKDFAIEPGGSCYAGNRYAQGESCSLLVRFTPQGPGHRLGFLSVTHSAETVSASFGLTGNGYSPVVSFTPSAISTIASTNSSGTGNIKSATNIAVDGGDIVYIADTGNNQMKKIDSSGALLPFANNPIATPVSVAVDSFGIAYTANTPGSTYYFSVYYPWGSETAYGYAHTAMSCTPGAPCAFSAVGMSNPAYVSIDNYDNLFFEEGTAGAAEMPVGSIAGGAGSFNLWYLSDQFAYSSGSPGSFAVDAGGNLYTDYVFSSTGTCYLIEEPLYNAEYAPTANRVAGGAACGFSGDGGQARGAELSTKFGQMAFDIAGNLYFVDAGNQRVRRIDVATGIINTIAGNGTAGYSGDGGAATAATLSNPTGLAVDSQGQVYILSNAPTAGPTQVIRKVGVTGHWYFGSQLKGTPSAAKVFTVANTGNTTLTLAANAALSGTNASDFAIDPTTTTCQLTTGATLAAGRSCFIGFIFTPTGGGARTAALQLMDNTVTGSNTITLSGTGDLPKPNISITSPTSGATIAHGTNITFAVSVTATGTKPTGTVTFKVGGTAIGSPVTLSTGGTASTTFSETTPAAYTLSATYNGDANYAATTKTESITVSAANRVVVTLLTARREASSCGVQQFAIHVSSDSGGIPTGTVDLMSGATKIGSAVLRDGAAFLSAGSQKNGSHSYFASYRGDELHGPAVSAAVAGAALPTDACVNKRTF